MQVTYSGGIFSKLEVQFRAQQAAKTIAIQTTQPRYISQTLPGNICTTLYLLGKRSLGRGATKNCHSNAHLITFSADHMDQLEEDSKEFYQQNISLHSLIMVPVIQSIVMILFPREW